MHNKTLITALICTSLTACTTVSVYNPDASKYKLVNACIERNDKVLVDDFLNVLQAGFLRHHIETTVYGAGAVPATCDTVVHYTAKRGWDVTPYMNYADVQLLRDGRMIGSATYEHKGGFALNKWASTETKMTPVIDQLLAGY